MLVLAPTVTLPVLLQFLIVEPAVIIAAIPALAVLDVFAVPSADILPLFVQSVMFRTVFPAVALTSPIRPATPDLAEILPVLEHLVIKYGSALALPVANAIKPAANVCVVLLTTVTFPVFLHSVIIDGYAVPTRPPAYALVVLPGNGALVGAFCHYNV